MQATNFLLLASLVGSIGCAADEPSSSPETAVVEKQSLIGGTCWGDNTFGPMLNLMLSGCQDTSGVSPSVWQDLYQKSMAEAVSCVKDQRAACEAKSTAAVTCTLSTGVPSSTRQGYNYGPNDALCEARLFVTIGTTCNCVQNPPAQNPLVQNAAGADDVSPDAGVTVGSDTTTTINP